jgi:phosphoglucomutase
MDNKEKIRLAINQISINNCDGSANEDAIKAVRYLQEVSEAEQLNLSGVSQRSELLPEFLMHDLDGKIITSVIGSADVTKEWNEYLGNCG